MTASHNFFSPRRNYNKWVNNQTMEDYALRFTALASRRWSLAQVANTALGAVSFLALEAIGGAVTLACGFTNAVAAIAVVSSLIFLVAVPICYHAARHGVDIDRIVIGALKMLAGSFLAYVVFSSAPAGTPAAQAADPTAMYQVAFGFLTPSPAAALWLAAVFVVICQLKINVTNACALRPVARARYRHQQWPAPAEPGDLPQRRAPHRPAGYLQDRGGAPGDRAPSV